MSKESELLSKNKEELEKIRLVKEIENIDKHYLRNPANVIVIVTSLLGCFAAWQTVTNNKEKLLKTQTELQEAKNKVNTTRTQLNDTKKVIKDRIAESSSAMTVILNSILIHHEPNEYRDSKFWHSQNLNAFKPMVDFLEASELDNELVYYYLALHGLNNDNPKIAFKYFSLLTERFPNLAEYYIGRMIAAVELSDYAAYTEAAVIALSAPNHINAVKLETNTFSLMRTILNMVANGSQEREYLTNELVLAVLVKSPHNWSLEYHFRLREEHTEFDLLEWSQTLQSILDDTPTSAVASKLLGDVELAHMTLIEKKFREQPELFKENCPLDLTDKFERIKNSYLQALKMTDIIDNKRDIHVALANLLVTKGNNGIGAFYHYDQRDFPESFSEQTLPYQIVRLLEQQHSELANLSITALIAAARKLEVPEPSTYQYFNTLHRETCEIEP